MTWIRYVPSGAPHTTIGTAASHRPKVSNWPAGSAATETPLEPPWPLSPQEQKTVVDFAERRDQFTAERADELALAAGPLVAGDERPAERLAAYARWIAGER